MIEINHFNEVLQLSMGHKFGERVLYWVAAYLVDGLLIDTGCKHTAEELADFLEGQYLKLAVNTHHHEDHIGANHTLKERFGIKVFASRESAPLINKVPKLLPYQEVVWGYPDPTEVDILPDTIETDHFRFNVIETPGHCKGHITLVEPIQGWCFSGDLYISRSPMAIRPEDDVAEIVRSMRKLVQLNVDKLILFTSLGNVELEGREALQSCIEYFIELSVKAKELQKQGFSTSAIRDRLFGRETSLAAPTNGDFSAKNMIRAVLRADI